jgi:hypothetical protein
MKMKIPVTILLPLFLALSSCLELDEEPILVINPTAEISAHVKDRKIYATSVINVNPQIIIGGNVAVIYDFSGELAIYNTLNGTIIDVSSISGGGLSQAYTVSADTLGHDRFIIIASGAIKVYSDLDKDGKIHSGNFLTEGNFYQESQFRVSELLN